MMADPSSAAGPPSSSDSLGDSSDSASRSASTVFRNISVKYANAINTLAVDSSGDVVALAGKKAVYLVNLDQPREPIRSWPSKWEVTAVEWNPAPASASLLATALNDELQLWDVAAAESRAAPLAVAKAHPRAISDLGWCVPEPQVLASASIDGLINVWDVREPRQPTKLRPPLVAHAAVSQVKWNRLNAHTLASAQGGELRLWDLRKPKEVVSSLRAHVAPINGVDWSQHLEHQLVTCSQETKVKFWHTALKNAPPVATIQTLAPVLRARYAPFGDALVTAAQKGDLALRLWTLSGRAGPQQVHVFNGHTDVVTAVDWRQKLGQPQLVSWSKDQTLKLWSLSPELLAACGPRPTPPPTRRASTAASNEFGNSIAASRSSSSGTTTAPGSGSDVGGSDSSLSAASLSSSPLNISHAASNSSSNAEEPADGASGQFLTLEQELERIQQHQKRHAPPPSSDGASVLVEKCNAVERSCVLVGRNEPLRQVAAVRVTFPALYPRGAAPAFEVQLQGGRSTLTPESAAALQEALRERAQTDADASRPCVARCVARLRHFMASELSAHLPAGNVALVSVPPTPATSNSGSKAVRSSMLGSALGSATILAENIPCPRLGGVTFSPHGGVLFFANFTRRIPPPLRTLEDLSVADRQELFAAAKPPSIQSIIGDIYGAMGGVPDAGAANSGPMLMTAGDSHVAAASSSSSSSSSSVASSSTSHSKHLSSADLLLDDPDPDADALESLRTPLDTTGSRTGALSFSPKPSVVLRSSASAASSSLSSAAAPRNRTCVLYRPLSAHYFSVSPALGSAYVLLQSTADTCTQNAGIAAAHGRPDLARLWSLLAVITEAHQRGRAVGGDLDTPWALHPFGKPLVQSLFRHYTQLRDLQTLAMMSCVLLPPRIRARRMDEFGNSVETYMKPSASALFALMMSQAQQSSSSSSMHTVSSTGSLNGSSSSGSVMSSGIGSSNDLLAAAARVSSPPALVQSPQLQQQQQQQQHALERQSQYTLLLDPTDAPRFNEFRRLYAELLFRWGEQQRAADVQKLVDSFAAEHRGLELGVVCVHCRRHIRGAYCGFCKKRGCYCAVCEQPVRGLGSFCTMCGHGGHTAHLRDWFAARHKPGACPAGCGCVCLEAHA